MSLSPCPLPGRMYGAWGRNVSRLRSVHVAPVLATRRVHARNMLQARVVDRGAGDTFRALVLGQERRARFSKVIIFVVMDEHVKHPASRRELREKIIETATTLFSRQGIRSVTMDDIAMTFGISKRTLYEVFADKETLLMECIRRGREENMEYVRQVAEASSNVLEVLLKHFLRSIENYHATNKRFFEDIKKYPRAYEQVMAGDRCFSEAAIDFFKAGVDQGLFRDDVNFHILGILLHEQLNLLMDSELCETYPFLEVYESIMFTFLRGISTPEGAAELERFIRHYREKKEPSPPAPPPQGGE